MSNKIKHIVDAKKLLGTLLPTLYAIQVEFYFIPKVAIGIITKELKLTEAYGVINFYHHFHLVVPGSNIFETCRREACQSMGSTALEHHVI